MRYLLLVLALLGTRLAAPAQYLSHLRAAADFPLYTTYAAALERSNFVLDEGYHFQYYLAGKGADFVTDTGGDWCLGFRQGIRWVYRVQDMHRAPVITKSYPDLVEYALYPFEGIKVSVQFVVYSSTGAVMEVMVENEGGKPVRFDLIPFLRSPASGFHRIEGDASGKDLVFSHQEHPDSWTLGHGLPFADSLRNVFRITDPRAKAIVFNTEAGESPLPPVAILRGQKAGLQVNGRLYGPTGDRVMDPAPVSRLQLYVDGDPSRIITENSPVWGSSQPAIDPDGYYRVEAAQLNPGAGNFRIAGYNQVLKASATAEGKLTAHPQRVNLTLGKEPGIPAVEALSISMKSGRHGLTWKGLSGPLTYAVYRRDYPGTVYTRIARKVTKPTFTAPAVTGKAVVGYVVVAENEKGNIGVQSEEVTNLPAADFTSFLKGQKTASVTGFAKILALPVSVNLAPSGSYRTRIIRTVQEAGKPLSFAEADRLVTLDFTQVLQADEKLFAQAPRPQFSSPDHEALYWSNFNMMRQVFYPPEGKSKYNYYVFSREPTWGWGHGGQVFHESIAMLAYAYLDPQSAMNSQRVYAQRQYPNGYINYRTGSWLDEIIEHNGELTSSAPWYAWLNWEVYGITKDKAFLREMYESSRRFYQFYVTQRDKDQDGLCEWGGEAVLESVRDALVAVWDQVGYPTNFESLDLNCMLVMEARSLEKMAAELGLPQEAARWRTDHQQRTNRINATFWDEKNGFYYNVDKQNHTFTHKQPDDLKRDEIIGFLPLWAGVATPERAKRLVAKLTDPDQFWRPYGVPSLSAKDPYYNPKGYWNGPVWVEWDYLIFRGLMDYGYKAEAKELTGRVAKGMTHVLRHNHNLWEFYSPDQPWGGYHKTYIWAGIINRMMLDSQL
jgi:hypothetical protein